jgi:hypothetical protein
VVVCEVYIVHLLGHLHHFGLLVGELILGDSQLLELIALLFILLQEHRVFLLEGSQLVSQHADLIVKLLHFRAAVVLQSKSLVRVSNQILLFFGYQALCLLLLLPHQVVVPLKLLHSSLILCNLGLQRSDVLGVMKPCLLLVKKGCLSLDNLELLLGVLDFL